jgi:hypothetical protein
LVLHSQVLILPPHALLLILTFMTLLLHPSFLFATGLFFIAFRLPHFASCLIPWVLSPR